jgi:hypothetical protein
VTRRFSRRLRRLAGITVAAVMLTGLPVAASATPAHATASPKTAAVCGKARPGYAQCLSIIRGRTGQLHLVAGALPPGYGPTDLRSAYSLPATTAGHGETVGIVDAFDDPYAESDLAVYRAKYGLPPCTTANGCFRKVAQDGSTRYPATDDDWSLEISLDLDMVSAICPNCHILLVEANDNSDANLGLAVNEAVALGAKYVSNSYGGGEGNATYEAQEDALYYNHPGVVMTAAAGDLGYGPGYPAASPYVTSVGGTSLTKTSSGWTETAWSGTGSGCSAFEPKPAWQQDSGCPRRTENDVSADADPNTGVAVYDSMGMPFVAPPGWNVFGGTSAASPIIASTYALAGTPTPGTYASSYPYAYPKGLHDITSGKNSPSGCTPAYLCTAGPGYDGPSGLGTPNGVAAFAYGVHGAHGDLAGTVTGPGGKPLAGAQVSTGGYTAVTDTAGHYELAAVPGTHVVTVAAFGYATKSFSSITVPENQTVTLNAALSAVPFETVSGTVTDGSGQKWPLLAKITVPGTSVTTYTNPATGKYSIKLPAGETYTISAAPVETGYEPASRQVKVPAAATSVNLAPQVDPAACDAAGYHEAPFFTQDFNQTALPSDWSVVNLKDDSSWNTWVFNNPGGVGNGTGGAGNFAVAYHGENGAGIADTELITPDINFSSDPSPSLTFDTWASSSSMTESVDMSTDGGATWTNVWANSGYTNEGTTETIPLAAARGHANVKLRFHLVDPDETGTSDGYWEVDNVSVANCAPAGGGLVVGTVRDANTGTGVDGATAMLGGSSATTSALPDPALSHGFFSLFVPMTGAGQVSVSASGYVTRTVKTVVSAHRASQAEVILPAGRVAVPVTPITATETEGGTTSATLTLRNTGSASATIHLNTMAGGYLPPGQSAGATQAPLQRIHGHFSSRPLAGHALHAAGRSTASWTDDAPWVPIGDVPQEIWGNTAAVDPVTGTVYMAGGATPADLNGLQNAWKLDPATARWTSLPGMAQARFGAQAAVISGRLYVTGGYYYNPGTQVAYAKPQLEIFDPVTGRWTQGAPIPHPFYGAATTVLDGKMYVIGGCDVTANCGEFDTQVYDPATDQWSSAAPYPIPAGELACGTITGRIYCAGGSQAMSGQYNALRAGYVFDPVKNAWSPIARLPIGLWGSAYGAADGRLVVSGGVTADSTVVTNQGFAYDPGSNAWIPLPNAPTTAYEGASACGFYQLGGQLSDGELTASAAQLPGYSGCGGQDWVSASPAVTTIGVGKSVTVKVTLTSAAPAVTQPGTYTARLRIGSDSPYAAPVIAVRLKVLPPRSWGEITGTVTGKSCTGATEPLIGASVQVDGQHGTWPLTTDTHGHYSLWLDAANDPVTLIVTRPYWKSQADPATIKPGATTTRNITLTPTACA